MDTQTVILEIKGFEASTNSDKTEGKGSKVHIGYFKYEADAQLAVKNKGVMGRDGDVAPVDKKIVIFGNFADYEAAVKEDLKEQALAKLTPAERAALGY